MKTVSELVDGVQYIEAANVPNNFASRLTLENQNLILETIRAHGYISISKLVDNGRDAYHLVRDPRGDMFFIKLSARERTENLSHSVHIERTTYENFIPYEIKRNLQSSAEHGIVGAATMTSECICFIDFTGSGSEVTYKFSGSSSLAVYDTSIICYPVINIETMVAISMSEDDRISIENSIETTFINYISLAVKRVKTLQHNAKQTLAMLNASIDKQDAMFREVTSTNMEAINERTHIYNTKIVPVDVGLMSGEFQSEAKRLVQDIADGKKAEILLLDKLANSYVSFGSLNTCEYGISENI